MITGEKGGWRRDRHRCQHRPRHSRLRKGSPRTCYRAPQQLAAQVAARLLPVRDQLAGSLVLLFDIDEHTRHFGGARANFYLYVVDNVAAEDQAKIAVTVLHGPVLSAMLDQAAPHITYWPTLRTSDYDQMTTGVG